MQVTESGAIETERSFAELGRQMPFARMTTLNGLANGTQSMTKDEVRNRFTLRRPDFILNTIYRKPGEDFATKTSPTAAVRINNDTTSKGYRKDFLAKFETGGTKSGDGHRIAIPIDVRRNKNEIVTQANRPKQVLRKPKVRLFRTVIVQAIGRAKSATNRLLYILKPSVTIPDRLSMRENAERVVERDFDRIASDAVDRALRTAFKR